MSSNRKYCIGFAIGLVTIATGILLAENFPWLAIFGPAEEINSLRSVIKLSFYVLVYIGGIILYITGSRENRKEYEGKPFKFLEVGRKYTILGIIKVRDYTHLFLEAETDIGNVINFARESNESPEDLKEKSTITQTEDDKISIIK